MAFYAGKCAISVPTNELAQGTFSILCYKKISALIMPHKNSKILYVLAITTNMYTLT